MTGTRAEYGLLKNVIKGIAKSKMLELKLIVTGSHLVPEYGLTIKEIERDGFKIDEQIDMTLSSYKKSSIVKGIGLELIQLGDVLERVAPDIIVLLGDRYEIAAVAMAATLMNIPIAHIAGGEITEGAIDETLRHAITKMAHLHFVEAKVYGDNVRRMGEESWRVFEVGALGIENIRKVDFLSEQQLKEQGIEVDKDTILVTYHPVTLEEHLLEEQIEKLLKALEVVNKRLIITYPNADQGGLYIIKCLKEYAKKHKNVILVPNLGVQKYLSVMKVCGAVVGNSSSALIEAPYLKVPVVNIGSRQKGRLMASNIVSCSNEVKDIIRSIELVYSEGFKEKLRKVESLYGEGSTSEAIIEVLEHMEINPKLIRKKLIWEEE